MINHHPKFELIQAYVNGDLPASVSAAIKIHADMCPECQEKILQLTEQVAEISFEKVESDEDMSIELSEQDADMLSQILADAEFLQTDDVVTAEVAERFVMFKGKNYKLPNVLANMEIGGVTNIGKLARSRVLLDEGEIRTSLLHIEPEGSVPQHTHKGFEITLLLDGEFSDKSGTYVKGDFIMLDGQHEHQPVSDNGCLCFTVVNDALHFTQGINKLLNPIGSLIY
ncbi:MAG: cupin domain-containing protein [Gammaproteobacteria bacterium]|nr:cupin domain-containing protein [Gammaproteobacteria bacterium]